MTFLYSWKDFSASRHLIYWSVSQNSFLGSEDVGSAKLFSMVLEGMAWSIGSSGFLGSSHSVCKVPHSIYQEQHGHKVTYFPLVFYPLPLEETFLWRKANSCIQSRVLSSTESGCLEQGHRDLSTAATRQARYHN